MRVSTLGIAVLTLTACGGETPEEPATPEAPPAQATEQADPRAPVVVYASNEDGNYWPQFFQAFTEETGIRVNVRTREQPVNVADVIANRGTPPADVLIVDGVHDLWRASDEGALRPLQIPGLSAMVDPIFRDPDGEWTALAVRTAMIVYRQDEFDFSYFEMPDYENLGDERFHGRLCLSSSRLTTNRALIAMLIDELGIRPAEILVREWVRNLAVPPFASEANLLDAIESGACGLGIVSSQAWAAQSLDLDDRGIVGYTPERAYASIEGIAVVRHANRPEAAQRMVAWLLADTQQSRHTEATFMLPVDTLPEIYPSFDDDWRELNRWLIVNREVSVAGWRDEEATLLAERARYP